MTDILVRVKSVFFVELPVNKLGQPGWINLAQVEDLTYEPESDILYVKFNSGKLTSFRGEQAQAIIQALREQSARTSL